MDGASGNSSSARLSLLKSINSLSEMRGMSLGRVSTRDMYDDTRCCWVSVSARQSRKAGQWTDREMAAAREEEESAAGEKAAAGEGSAEARDAPWGRRRR